MSPGKVPFKKSSVMRCNPGEAYCMETGTCSKKCVRNSKDSQSPSNRKLDPKFDICRPGETFCMTTGKCSRKCDDETKNSNHGSDQEKCSDGEVFCMATGNTMLRI